MVILWRGFKIKSACRGNTMAARQICCRDSLGQIIPVSKDDNICDQGCSKRSLTVNNISYTILDGIETRTKQNITLKHEDNPVALTDTPATTGVPRPKTHTKQSFC